ncbi:MAG: hypothetical protein RIC56_11005 [Pseudomonadales bacterium]
MANFEFLNNIVIGTTVPAKITSQIILGRIDGNVWYPPYGAYEYGFAQPHFGVRSSTMGPTISMPPTLVEPQ